MSSPSDLDMDMDLASPSSPPPRGETGEDRVDVIGGGGIGIVNRAAATVPARPRDDGAFDPLAKGGDDGGRRAGGTSDERHHRCHRHQGGANEFAGGNDATATTAAGRDYDASRDGEDDRSGLKYDDAMRLVESWREELCMMTVRNSILLDDLVKLGASDA